LDGDYTDQHVRRSALDSTATAKVVQARGFLVMECCEWFIPEGLERGPQFMKMSQILNAGKNFLPDWANDSYPAILDCFRKRSEHELLFAAQGSPVPAPQLERPGARIDQDLHGSISIRSSWRTFL
jgi:hypothetical protein